MFFGADQLAIDALRDEISDLLLRRAELYRQVSDLEIEVNNALKLVAYLVDKCGGLVRIPVDYLSEPERFVSGLAKTVDAVTNDWIFEVIK